MGLNTRQKEPPTTQISGTETAAPLPISRTLAPIIVASCLIALALLLAPALRTTAALNDAQKALQNARSRPGDPAVARDAIVAVSQAQALAPDDSGLYRALAELHMLAGEPRAAVAALERAHALLADSPLIMQELALAYEAAGDADAARAQWAELGQTSLGLTQVGERYRRAGRLEEAAAWYRRAAELDPSLADPWYYSGLIAESRASWAEAQANFDAALARPVFVGVGASDVLTQKGLAYAREDPGQAPQALALFEQARARADFRSNLLAATAPYEIGRMLEARGDNPAAAAAYRDAVTIRPGHQWARMRLGRLLSVYLDDPAGAEAQLRWVIDQIRENPDHKWAYRWLGDLYRTQGHRDEAVAAYHEAARLDPSDTAIQKELAALQPSN